jgi:TRAP-type C4-dicarboxylate transport system permease small subunit
MDRLAMVAGKPLSWLFIFATAISAYEVVMRYVFSAPSTWIHVTATAACAIAFSFGGAWCMARDEHIRITVLTDRFPPAITKALEFAGNLIGLFYLLGLSWGLWLQAKDSILRFDGGIWRPELTPGPPNWALPATIKGALLLAALMFAGVVFARLIRAFVKR